CLQGYNDPFTF
nr:immunoglobulin light chain junction region [Macaca mulatta]MOW08423.1 immunoglobulin light chain junction region [Macaca mulatta]MOW09011.1 immunoglobulin light chain junction region [Macaca mulatta]MOW09789.1 immunoglobulin light chain junction region [Macaca mulatta]MOW10800.1 immunoglobulin light chain junction region [Macaca mulatta]